MLVVEIGSSLVKNDIRYDVTIFCCWNNQHLSDGSDQRPKNIRSLRMVIGSNLDGNISIVSVTINTSTYRPTTTSSCLPTCCHSLGLLVCKLDQNLLITLTIAYKANT